MTARTSGSRTFTSCTWQRHQDSQLLDRLTAHAIRVADPAAAGGTLTVTAACRALIPGLDTALRAAATVSLATTPAFLIRDAAPGALFARSATGDQRTTDALEATGPGATTGAAGSGRATAWTGGI